MKPFNIVVMMALTGCVIPLGSIQKAKSVDSAYIATQSPLCDSIDRERSFWTVAATSLATIAGGSGITSIPVDDPEVKRGLAVAAGAAGGLGAIAAIVAADRAQRWVKMCQ